MAASTVEVKICGIREETHLKAAIDAGADYLGFVFVSGTARHITPQDAAAITTKYAQDIRPQGRKIVAVMADPSDQDLANVLSVLSPDIIQLHGDESRERVREIGGLYDIRIMKALAVSSRADVEAAQSYVGYADMLLFDAKAATGPNGGTGKTFDWNLLQDNKVTLPWFLSGGLDARNVLEAISITGAKKVDVSSGVESSRGQKDSALISEFVKTVRSLDSTSEETHDDA